MVIRILQRETQEIRSDYDAGLHRVSWSSTLYILRHLKSRGRPPKQHELAFVFFSHCGYVHYGTYTYVPLHILALHLHNGFVVTLLGCDRTGCNGMGSGLFEISMLTESPQHIVWLQFHHVLVSRVRESQISVSKCSLTADSHVHHILASKRSLPTGYQSVTVSLQKKDSRTSHRGPGR